MLNIFVPKLSQLTFERNIFIDFILNWKFASVGPNKFTLKDPFKGLFRKLFEVRDQIVQLLFVIINLVSVSLIFDYYWLCWFVCEQFLDLFWHFWVKLCSNFSYIFSLEGFLDWFKRRLDKAFYFAPFKFIIPKYFLDALSFCYCLRSSLKYICYLANFYYQPLFCDLLTINFQWGWVNDQLFKQEHYIYVSYATFLCKEAK